MPHPNSTLDDMDISPSIGQDKQAIAITCVHKQKYTKQITKQ